MRNYNNEYIGTVPGHSGLVPYHTRDLASFFPELEETALLYKQQDLDLVAASLSQAHSLNRNQEFSGKVDMDVLTLLFTLHRDYKVPSSIGSPIKKYSFLYRPPERPHEKKTISAEQKDHYMSVAGHLREQVFELYLNAFRNTPQVDVIMSFIRDNKAYPNLRKWEGPRRFAGIRNQTLKDMEKGCGEWTMEVSQLALSLCVEEVMRAIEATFCYLRWPRRLLVLPGLSQADLRQALL